jgi:Flp pilus assembly protein TadG
MIYKIIARITRQLSALRSNSSGNMMMLSAIAMPVLVGMAGLAIEGGNWYQTKRLMQNAADSAAIAAATNNTASRYAYEAKAVTGQYGFTDGSSNTTVTASNTATCPGGGSTCYSVTISKNVSLVFSRLIGFMGSTALGSGRAITLNSVAVASRANTTREYCILALNTIGTALTSNGAPNADLNGCNVMSDSNATCNGHDLDAAIGDAAGINNGCGDVQNSNVPYVADPYSGLATNIPSDTCGSYPQATIHNNGKTVTSVGSATGISGSYATTGNWVVCGDLVLTGDVTLTGSSVVIVIYNGDFLTNGNTITTASGAAATIVFAGSSSYSHIPNTTGTIDIKAPTSGTWSGVALYQDPNMTASSGLDIDYRGNNPKTPVWNISGLIYMPKANVSFSGVVNKASNGGACFGMVVWTLLINGNGSIFEQGSCAPSGLTLPSNSISDRGKLVS